MARRLGDPATLAYALDGFYAGIRYPQHTAEWRAMGNELVAAAEAAGDKERAWAGHQHLVGPLMLAGDLDGVDEELEAMERLLEELRQPAHMWAHSLSQTMRVLFAGRFEEAEALLEGNRELGRRAQTPDITYTGARVLVLFVLRREQDRLDEVEAPLAHYVDEYPELVVHRSALAALRCDLGRHAGSPKSAGGAGKPTASPTCPRGRSGSSRPVFSPRSAPGSAIVRALPPCTSCCSRMPTATC